MSDDAIAAVERYFLGLQDRICTALAEEDGGGQEFAQDSWRRDAGGGGCSRVLRDGAVFEQAGVNYSHVHGSGLPAAATALRPELAGRPFQALGVSLVIHPRNPFVPTSHCNVRYFQAGETYARLKARCDEYFYLPHRGEPRGVGGLFFDDHREGGFEPCFAFTRSVGDHFLPAYLPIVARRKALPYGDRERDFQLYRRGRYVEFNLIHDRGTLFGLQSGGRTESILMSLPPLAAWRYGWQPDPGSAEARLYERYLQPRDWLAEGAP